MKDRIPYRRRIDYQNSLEDRRILSMYLQAGRYRKPEQYPGLEYPVRKARLILYGLAGLLFGIGLLFVFF